LLIKKNDKEFTIPIIRGNPWEIHNIMFSKLFMPTLFDS
jgi:hypothetical protein